MKFRDRKTGRFVSRATWTRSKAKGGTRYVRINRKLSRQPMARQVRKLAKAKGIPPPAQIRKKKPETKPVQVITRRRYRRKKSPERTLEIEIISTGKLKDDLSNITQVSIGENQYSGQKDIEALRSLLEATSDRSS